MPVGLTHVGFHIIVYYLIISSQNLKSFNLFRQLSLYSTNFKLYTFSNISLNDEYDTSIMEKWQPKFILLSPKAVKVMGSRFHFLD